jgi:hypothetical protein
VDAHCGAGGRCTLGTCLRPCDGSVRCGTGQSCRDKLCQPSPTAGGECVFSSTCNGGTCINGYCHAACTKDADCPNRADACDHGLCRPDGRPLAQCVANADCAASRLCVDAVCRTPCMSDAQCGPGCSGTICRAGFCFMPEELEPTCAPTPACQAPAPCGPPPPCR